MISCCGGIVKSDPVVEVRQAAAMLISLLFQGLGTDAIKVCIIPVRPFSVSRCSEVNIMSDFFKVKHQLKLILQILESAIKDLYKLLKHVASTEKEQSVLIHVHLALQELDGIMRELLFPKQTLTKRIRVLDPE